MKRVNIRTDDALAIGTDHQFIFHIKNDDESASVDITGWTLSFRIKRKLTDADAAALVTKTASVGGSFNSTPTLNAQRATVTVEDTDTDTVTPGVCYYELKRTDAGFETILVHGTINLWQAVHRA